MGLIDFLRKIFGNKSDAAALQSDAENNRSASAALQDYQSDAAALQSASTPMNQEIPDLPDFTPKEEPELFYQPLPKTIPAGQLPQQPQISVAQLSKRPAFPPRQQTPLPRMPVFAEPPKRQPTIELQKDSLELGMAAGYAGRSLKEIESSMNRIESMMASKEWFSSQFGPQLRAIYDSIRIHDENAAKKLEIVQKMIENLRISAENVPEPLKTSLMQQIDAVEAELPLSPKMQKLVNVVEQSGKLSYDDLCAKLGVQRSSLRGLLANTMKRTSMIERYVEDGQHMVRIKQ
jgi:hypothetical protein